MQGTSCVTRSVVVLVVWNFIINMAKSARQNQLSKIRNLYISFAFFTGVNFFFLPFFFTEVLTLLKDQIYQNRVKMSQIMEK